MPRLGLMPLFGFMPRVALMNRVASLGGVGFKGDVDFMGYAVPRSDVGSHAASGSYTGPAFPGAPSGADSLLPPCERLHG